MTRIEKLERLLVRSCKLLESEENDFQQDEADALCEEIREEVKVD